MVNKSIYSNMLQPKLLRSQTGLKPLRLKDTFANISVHNWAITKSWKNFRLDFMF